MMDSTCPFSHLPADPALRFRAVLHAVHEFSPPHLPNRPRLLDVGGFPCTFARTFREQFPRWEAITVDTPQEAMEGYVAGSGMELPFADGEFDAVVTVDTFEHIPAAERRRFVGELCRVSRGLVVLAAPFFHPSVESVERLLNTAHERSFHKPHPWLHEHVSFGLPKVGETVAQWPASHGLVAIQRSYDLTAWTFWQCQQLMAKARGELDNSFAAYDRAAAAASIPPVGEVPYRRVFIGRKGQAAGSFQPPAEPPASAGQAAVELARLQVRLLELTISEQQGQAVSQLPTAVDKRLREALVAAEKEIERLQREKRAQGGRGILRRILGR